MRAVATLYVRAAPQPSLCTVALLPKSGRFGETSRRLFRDRSHLLHTAISRPDAPRLFIVVVRV